MFIKTCSRLLFRKYFYADFFDNLYKISAKPIRKAIIPKARKKSASFACRIFKTLPMAVKTKETNNRNIHGFFFIINSFKRYNYKQLLGELPRKLE